MTERHTTVAIQDGIMVVTLNRPDRLNAFTAPMGVELADAMGAASDDDAVRVVIVTGAGRCFCAGADISPEKSWFNDPNVMSRSGSEGGFPLKIFECTKPVIAAINGPAVGIGVTMTLPMDIRITSDTAKFGFVFTRRGLVPEAGSAWFLPRIVGLPKALEWVYAGRMVSVEEAHRAGLVNEVVPPENLMPRTLELAREIADNTSAVAVSLTRQLMWRASAADHPLAALRLDAPLNRQLAHTPDVIEGIAAFREKRPPAFPGRPSADMPPLYPWW